MWGNMNDDQRMWIVGSYFFFACNEGFTNLKGYDLSADGSKNMLAGKHSYHYYYYYYYYYYYL